MPIIITSKKAGFRRCGIAHPAKPVEYPDDRFTPEQLEKLQKEPMLVVVALVNLPEGLKETADKNLKSKIAQVAQNLAQTIEANLDPAQLETMGYPELKKLAKDMNLEFKGNISKEDLIKLIASEPVFADKSAIVTSDEDAVSELQQEHDQCQDFLEQNTSGADQ